MWNGAHANVTSRVVLEILGCPSVHLVHLFVSFLCALRWLTAQPRSTNHRWLYSPIKVATTGDSWPMEIGKRSILYDHAILREQGAIIFYAKSIFYTKSHRTIISSDCMTVSHRTIQPTWSTKQTFNSATTGPNTSFASQIRINPWYRKSSWRTIAIDQLAPPSWSPTLSTNLCQTIWRPQPGHPFPRYDISICTMCFRK